MAMHDAFKSDADLQIIANAKLAEIDLSQYNRVETMIDDATNHDSQNILATLKSGDRLKIIQIQVHSRQKIEVFTPSGKLIGHIPHALVDELTFKKDVQPDSDINFDHEKYFYFLSGFAVVKTITGGGKIKYKCEIDLFYIKH